MSDAVRHPGHYSGDGRVECMDAISSMLCGYSLSDCSYEEAYWCATALKYLWRWPLKGGRQDLEKAMTCIRYALGSEEEEDGR